MRVFKKLRKTLVMFLTLGMALTVIPTVNAEPGNGKVYYVAVDGDNNNPGTIDKPFANIEGARDAIRELKKTSGLPKGGITVYLRGGTYRITKGIELTAEDAGTEESPILYKAYGTEQPVISGGVSFKLSDFEKVKDKEILDRIPSAKAKKNLMCLDLNKYLSKEEYQGIIHVGKKAIGELNETAVTDIGADDIVRPWSVGGYFEEEMPVGTELFCGQKRLDMARWPNRLEDEFYADYTLTAGMPDKDKKNVFNYSDSRIEKWKSYDYAGILFFTNWYDCLRGIKNIDLTSRTIELTANYQFLSTNSEYFYFNVLDELDVPGEYYIDIDTGMVYLYPESTDRNIDYSIATFGSYKTDALLKVLHASNTTFSGIDFTLSRANGVQVMGGENVLLINCEVYNIGVTGVNFGMMGVGHWEGDFTSVRGLGATFYGIELDGGKEPWKTDLKSTVYYDQNKGYNFGFVNGKITNCGNKGIQMRGGDRIDVDNCNYYCDNSIISRCGMLYPTTGNNVSILGQGLSLTNCTIYDNPSCAVEFGGSELIMEHNEVYNIMRDGSDMGAFYARFYCAGTMPKTSISYNYIHDIPRTFTKGGTTTGAGTAWGEDIGKIINRPAIYSDGCNPFLETNYNIFENLPIANFCGGYETNMKYNICINVDKPRWALVNDSVGLAIKQGKTGEDIFNASSAEMKYFDTNKAWREHYPEVHEVREAVMARGSNANQPYFEYSHNYNLFDKNPNKLSPKFTSGITECVRGFETNINTTDDPGFVDLKNRDYRFKEDAKIFEIDPEFKKVDITTMGYHKDKYGEVLDNSVILKIGKENANVFGKSSFIDNTNADVKPIIDNGRTLVPVRFISEAFGGNVTWDDTTRTVGIKTDDKEISMQLDSKSYTVNGEAKELDVPAQSINGRTLVPLRALVEALGKEVFWDDRGLIVISDKEGLLNSESDKDTITEIVKYADVF